MAPSEGNHCAGEGCRLGWSIADTLRARCGGVANGVVGEAAPFSCDQLDTRLSYVGFRRPLL